MQMVKNTIVTMYILKSLNVYILMNIINF